jgi:hypothetical protein
MCKNSDGSIERCHHCGDVRREVRNPFYGTGLAVHEWLMVCDRCSAAEYARNCDDVSVAAVEELRAQKRRWRWLSGSGRREGR